MAEDGHVQANVNVVPPKTFKMIPKKRFLRFTKSLFHLEVSERNVAVTLRLVYSNF